MPLPETLDLAENQFALHFETNEQLDAGRLGRVLQALSTEASRFKPFKHEAQLTVRSLKSGSPTTVILDVVFVMGSLATIGGFVILVADKVANSKSSAISRRVAELMEDDGVAYLEVAHIQKGKLNIVRMEREELPAIRALRTRRQEMDWYRYFNGEAPNPSAKATSDSTTITADSSKHAQGGSNPTFDGATPDEIERNFLQAEDGSVLTTEDGEPIEMEGSTWKRPGVKDLSDLAAHAFDPAEPFPITGQFVPVASGDEVIFQAGNRSFKLDMEPQEAESLPIGAIVSVMASIDTADPRYLHIEKISVDKGQ